MAADISPLRLSLVASKERFKASMVPMVVADGIGVVSRASSGSFIRQLHRCSPSNHLSRALVWPLSRMKINQKSYYRDAERDQARRSSSLLALSAQAQMSLVAQH